MRYYETLYMINPNLPDSAYEEIKDKFTALSEKNSGVLVNIDDWGKKSLAYQVKNFDKGYYVLLQYCGEGNIVAEIEHGMRLDERVLKFQTVKLSDQADPEQLKLEAEKARKSKNTSSENPGTAASEGTEKAEKAEPSKTDDED